MKINFIKIYVITAILLTGCNSSSPTTGDSSQSLNGKLIVTGSSTIAPLASELARLFEQKNPQVKVDVQTGGSSRGIADVRRGISNIGMVSRKLKATENDLTPHLLAIDGVSVIVHKENPIQSLSDNQIKAIYLGKIKNWKTLNGIDREITVINKAEGRSTLEVFTKYYALKNSDIKAGIIIGDNEQGIKLVAKNKHAIAYVSIGTAEYDMSLGIPIKTLPLNNIAATRENLINHQFPLSRELNLITQGAASGLSLEFLNFTRSSDIHSVIEDYGFVPTQ